MVKNLELDQLIQTFFKMQAGASVTKGSYSIKSYCGLNDLEWNQMDQDHRPYIHSTYLDAIRMWSTEDSQLSLSKLRFFGLSFYILVTDVRIKPGYYYQSFTLFSIFYVHAVTICTSETQYGEWYIFSHWLFKPFQLLLSRKMKTMNEKQNPEDVLLRKRRAELRDLGYTFIYDSNLNFITANSKGNNVVYPKITRAASFDLSNLSADMSINEGQISLYVKKGTSVGEYLIWHGVCPHEGAPINESSVCEGLAKCRWHGLTFKALNVKSDGTEKNLFNMVLWIDANQQLHVKGLG